jgi:hypothetical protein
VRRAPGITRHAERPGGALLQAQADVIMLAAMRALRVTSGALGWCRPFAAARPPLRQEE